MLDEKSVLDSALVITTISDLISLLLREVVGGELSRTVEGEMLDDETIFEIVTGSIVKKVKESGNYYHEERGVM